jgi:hypothetical protein
MGLHVLVMALNPCGRAGCALVLGRCRRREEQCGADDGNGDDAQSEI